MIPAVRSLLICKGCEEGLGLLQIHGYSRVLEFLES